LIEEEVGQLSNELPEVTGVGRLVGKQGDLVRHQRVIAEAEIGISGRCVVHGCTPVYAPRNRRSGHGAERFAIFRFGSVPLTKESDARARLPAGMPGQQLQTWWEEWNDEGPETSACQRADAAWRG